MSLGQALSQSCHKRVHIGGEAAWASLRSADASKDIAAQANSDDVRVGDCGLNGVFGLTG